MVMAPLVGLAVDAVAASGMGGSFWPIGVLGVAVTVVFLTLQVTGTGNR